MLIVTLIGARDTPESVLVTAERIGVWLRENGHIGRSGHAPGFDWYGERGLKERGEVFLPYPGFNKKFQSPAKYILVPKDIKYDRITDKYHPAPKNLNPQARQFMNRNACQVMGFNLDKLSDVVVCYTADGKASGGTGQAIRIAEAYNIPVLNIQREEFNTFEKVIAKLLEMQKSKTSI